VGLGGCGGSDLPDLVPVEGTVTLDGVPVKQGIVAFVPDKSKGTTGPTGEGAIDENGHYEIRTAGQKGAVIGYHQIRVIARENQFESDKPPGRWIVPERYSREQSSGLTFEVKAGQKNEKLLELTSP